MLYMCLGQDDSADLRTVLRASESDGGAAARGLLSTHIHSDGRHHDALYVDGGPSSNGQVGHLRMQGKEVFQIGRAHV